MANLTLKQRIQRLEDIEAIKNLQWRYAHAVDQGWNGKMMEWETVFDQFFTEDASWESPASGMFAKGKEQITGLFKGLSDAVKLALHSMTNPIIEVNGDTATGKWILLNPNSFQNAEKMNFGFCSDVIDYARTPKGWRIKKLLVYVAGKI